MIRDFLGRAFLDGILSVERQDWVVQREVAFFEEKTRGRLQAHALAYYLVNSFLSYRIIMKASS